MMMGLKIHKPVVFGFLASLGLLVLYFLIMAKAVSFAFGLNQLLNLWYLFLPLVSGFGFQIGLYLHLRESLRAKMVPGQTAITTASGSLSAVSMLACCAHHLVDVLPLLGLTVAAVFLAQYQPFFLLLGILSNLVGIVLLLEVFQKHHLGK